MPGTSFAVRTSDYAGDESVQTDPDRRTESAPGDADSESRARPGLPQEFHRRRKSPCRQLFSCPSSRTSRAPTAAPASGETSRRPRSSGLKNRADNLAIARAAAEHAADRVHHFVFVGRWIFLEQRRRRNQHARACMLRIAPRREKETIAASSRTAAIVAASPSTVVISHPATCPAATRHAQTGSPFSRTVQAPQSPASHPTFVPVSPRSSRSTRERRRVPRRVTSTRRPFTENEINSAPSLIRSFSVIAMSAAPHAGFQSAPHQRQRRIAPVFCRGAHVINRRKRGEMLWPSTAIPIPV